MVVNLPITGMTGCCPRQRVGVERVGRVSGWLFASSVVCLSNAKFSYCPCSVLVCVRDYFGIPVTLNDTYFLGVIAMILSSCS